MHVYMYVSASRVCHVIYTGIMITETLILQVATQPFL